MQNEELLEQIWEGSADLCLGRTRRWEGRWYEGKVELKCWEGIVDVESYIEESSFIEFLGCGGRGWGTYHHGANLLKVRQDDGYHWNADTQIDELARERKEYEGGGWQNPSRNYKSRIKGAHGEEDKKEEKPFSLIWRVISNMYSPNKKANNI